MRTIIAASLLALSGVACYARAEPIPQAPQTVYAAPAPAQGPGTSVAPAPQVPTTGGASMETAEPIAMGSTMEGWASKDQQRWYRIDMAQPGELRFSLFTQIMANRGQGAGVGPMVYIVNSQGGKLNQWMAATYATSGTGNFDQIDASVAVPQTGAIYIQIDCQDCGAEMVHYKIVIP